MEEHDEPIDLAAEVRKQPFTFRAIWHARELWRHLYRERQLRKVPNVVRFPDGSACFTMDIGPREPGFFNWLKFHKQGYARRWLFTVRQYRSARTLSHLN